MLANVYLYLLDDKYARSVLFSTCNILLAFLKHFLESFLLGSFTELEHYNVLRYMYLGLVSLLINS